MVAKICVLFGLAIGMAASAQGASVMTTLVQPGSSMNYLIPINDNVDAVWRANAFDDSGWSTGILGAGYGSLAGGGAEIMTNIGVELRTVGVSAYFRVPFDIVDASAVTALDLSMWYDDGFVASLNGVVFASGNAPLAPAYNTPAEFAANEQIPFEMDMSGQIGLLNDGENILAIHGMNVAQGSSDFIISPTLTAVIPEPSGFLLLLGGISIVALRRRR